MNNIELDIIEKGFYEVYVDGVKVSQHSKPMKAASRAQQEKALNKDSDVYVLQPNLVPVSVVECEDVTEPTDPVEPTDPIEPLPLPNDNRAFPTALGAGAFARADVNYDIYEVTNLNPTGEGSFYSGLASNRIIVFKVAGIINLNGIFSTQNFSNLIVLGQTAPKGGITVSGNGWRWDGCKNVIFRYVKFRTWQCQDDVFAPCSSDSIDNIGSQNVIFDHCSFAFGGDETLSFRGDSHTITVQNSIMAYGNAGMLAGDSDDTSRSYDISLLHNFWHTLGKRTPNPNSNGRIDVIGNVTYNILNLLMRTGGDLKLNEIGNHYSRSSLSRLSFGGGASPKIHTSNNRFNDSITENGQDNSVMWGQWLDGRDPNSSDFVDQYEPINYNLQLPDGDVSKAMVINKEVGANVYLDDNGNPVFDWDEIDAFAYDEYVNGDAFDWDDGTGNRTQASWRKIPQRQWLVDKKPIMNTVLNEHSSETHTYSVPNSWILSKGLEPSTFNPVGNDLHEFYTNVEVYSFRVDA